MKPIKKQVVWCQEQISKGDKFFNVIWMDECLVQLDNHGRLCFRRKKEKHKLKPRPKHPLRLHVWTGISAWDVTPIVIFSSIFNSYMILWNLAGRSFSIHWGYFSSWAQLLEGQWSPKHCSKYTKKVLVEKVNWWKTPVESQDWTPLRTHRHP